MPCEIHKELRQTLNAIFIESLQQYALRAPNEHPVRTETALSRHGPEGPNHTEGTHPLIPIHRRADEEARLRPCCFSDEEACSMGARCEGHVLALSQETQGFTLVQYDTSDPRCLLCRRAEACQRYHLAQVSGRPPPPFPWRNLANTVGEYTMESTFNSTSTPFVRHERHRYRYQPGGRTQNFPTISQTHVNFHMPPIKPTVTDSVSCPDR